MALLCQGQSCVIYWPCARPARALDPGRRTRKLTAPEPILGALEHELSHELWSGPLGRCWAGHITAGYETGRTVVVRRVHGLGARARTITDAAQQATRLSHPTFVKVLGGLDMGSEVRVISEDLR